MVVQAKPVGGTQLFAGFKVSSKVMKKIMINAQKNIRIRTLRGKGVYGPENNPREQKHKKGYSEAPALVPITSAPLRKHYRAGLKGGRRKGGMKKGESKAKFVYLDGGYKQYRRIHGRNVSQVDHSFSGFMLGSIRVFATNRTGELTVPASQLKKAFYTNQLRPWFKMTKPEIIVAGDIIATEAVRLYK